MTADEAAAWWQEAFGDGDPYNDLETTTVLWNVNHRGPEFAQAVYALELCRPDLRPDVLGACVERLAQLGADA